MLSKRGYTDNYSYSEVPVIVSQAMFGMRQPGLLSAILANKTELRTMQLLHNKRSMRPGNRRAVTQTKGADWNWVFQGMKNLLHQHFLYDMFWWLCGQHRTVRKILGNRCIN